MAPPQCKFYVPIKASICQHYIMAWGFDILVTLKHFYLMKKQKIPEKVTRAAWSGLPFFFSFCDGLTFEPQYCGSSNPTILWLVSVNETSFCDKTKNSCEFHITSYSMLLALRVEDGWENTWYNWAHKTIKSVEPKHQMYHNIGLDLIPYFLFVKACSSHSFLHSAIHSNSLCQSSPY